VAGFDQVQSRAHPGRRRCGRCDQDGRGHAARGAAPDAARGHPVVPCGLGRRCGGAADRADGVAGSEPAASRRGLVIRDQRHQRARGTRTGARPRRAGQRRDHGACAGGRVGQVRERAAGAGRTARRPPGRQPQPLRPGLLARHHPGEPDTSRGGRRRRPGFRAHWADGTRQRRRGGWSRQRRGTPNPRPGAVVRRSGWPAGRHGSRAVPTVPGVRSGVRRRRVGARDLHRRRRD